MKGQIIIKKKTVIPITVQGAVMAKARTLYGDDAQLQPSDVRVESVLDASSVNTSYNLNGRGALQRPTEVFIGRNDLFIMYALKVGIQKIDTTATITTISSGNYPTYSYPDKFIFTDPATATNVSEANALEAVWNGRMSMKANTYELINQVKLDRFRIVYQTQESALTQAQSDQRGFVIFEQPAILSGRDTNLLDFIQAAGADVGLIGGAINTQNILVFHALGITYRNGAQPPTLPELEELAFQQRLKDMTVDGRLLK